jgi:sigma-B regulation protein RsbU (phosphoserine phosphatase)
MRDEIADARKIQLSMLPLAAPDVPWLELSSVSLPANEVGGDYYDYVPLDGGSLALVVGDVAGHGVASGLVLSGVRSGLYLLRDELGSPAAAVGKLNRMVRDSARWRMYVTLLVAVLDPEARLLRAVSAGHPPLLCWSRRRREVVELGAGAAPLGTGLPPSFQEVELPLEEGDVVVLYSDGLTETRNLAGDVYGIDRLGRELANLAELPTALKIRDGLLHALSRFKGDAQQTDDLTLLVGRVRGLEAR